MKAITLDAVIAEQKKMDPDFSEEYQKELLINEISKLVIKLRSITHLTQAELANKAGTTQPVIARLESGTDTRVPSLLLLAKIAAASHAKLHISIVGVKRK